MPASRSPYLAHHIIYWSIFICCSTCVTTYAQVVNTMDHPNHYVLLIDASYSAMPKRNRIKKEAFEKAVLRTLPTELFEKGFNKKIPLYDPQQDYLTVLHFGMVHGTSQRDSLLRQVNFSTELIHPAFVWKQNVSRDALESQLLPHELYEYTFMSWTKELAIEAAKQPSPNTGAHHTFLIVVHDGLFNENKSPQKELDWISTLGNPSFEATERLVETIAGTYQLTNGSGKREKIERDQLPERSPLIFVDAYEILSSAQLEWEQAIGREAFDETALEWSGWFNDGKEGKLTVRLNREFLNALAVPPGTRATVKLESSLGASESNVSLSPLISVPVRFDRASSCGSEHFKVILSIPVVQSDPYLGTRTVVVSKEREVTAPLPFRCTWWATVWFWARLLLILLLLAAFGYFLYFRFYTTHIDLMLPGLVVPIRLKRHGTIHAGTPVAPKQGLEALSLRLPRRGLQHFFHRGALLKIQVDGNSTVHWLQGDGKKEVVELPIVGRKLVASWDNQPANPAKLVIEFHQGRQHGLVSVSFPKGMSAK